MSAAFKQQVGEHIFQFQPVEIKGQMSYHVDVTDKEGKRWEFRMHKQEGETIELEGENLPQWITENETALIEAVRQHE